MARPLGSKNKRTAAREEAVVEAGQMIARRLGKHDFGGDAHAFLMSIYRDTRLDLALRVDAGKAALPYEKPRLGALKIAGDEEGAGLVVQIVKFADLPPDKQLAYEPLARLPAAGSAD